MSLYELDDELVQEFVDSNWVPGPGGLLAEALTVILARQRKDRQTLSAPHAIANAVGATVAAQLRLTPKQIISVNLTADSTIVEYGRHGGEEIEHRIVVIDNETGDVCTDAELRRYPA